MNQDKIFELAANDVPQGKLFINGAWILSQSGRSYHVISPINGRHLTTIELAQPEDVDAAVAAARASFAKGSWSRMAPAGRKKILHKIADLIEQNAEELAVLGVRDNGTEIAMALKAEPGSAAATFRFYAEAVDKIYGEIAPTADQTLGLIHREPVGVVGAIVPWNFPLMIGAWKIAPALATGNSMVLKPSEVASLSLLRLAELCAEAGLPEGVLNIITGDGSAGEAMGRHMDIDVLVFTGSGHIGRKLLEYSAQSNLKRVYLELGGKSPNLIFEDVDDLDNAALVSAMGIFRDSGQVCVSGSRVLVQRSIHDAFLEKFIAVSNSITVGNPLDVTTQSGAVANASQLQRNLGFVEMALEEGGRLVAGGKRILEDTGGFYMQPTIFDGVTADMRLARDEVFGPVAAVMTFEDEADAIRLANDTDYGLAAGVWTSNLSRAHRMVREIAAGVVHVNTYGGPDVTVPLGGHKQSGNGHDKSLHALDKYTNLKTAWIQL